MMHLFPPLLSSNLAEAPNIMDTEYLVRLAHQLRIDKTPACRRAINRILEEMKKRCEEGEYRNPMEAESAFRKFVEDERSCQKAKAV
jgi:hypothetical protein